MKKFTTFLFATVAATALLSSDAMAAKHKKAKKARKKAPHAVECPSKVSAPVTAVAAVAAPCASTNMSGFYLGASAGAALNAHETNFTNYGSQTFKVTGSKVLPAFGLFAGYNHQMGSALLGAELLLSHDSNKMSVWDDNSTQSDFPHVNVRKGLSYGVAARLGVLLNSSTNLYVRLGAEKGPKVTISSADSGANLDKSTVYKKNGKLSFVPGLGIETFVNQNLFLRAEYKLLMAKKVTVAATGLYAGGTATLLTVKPKQHIVSVAVGYKF